MTEWLWAVGLGTAGGVLAWAAVRVPLLAWIALAPLGVALLTLPPPFAALAAAFTGSIASVEPVSSRTLRVLVLPAAAVSGLGWGAAFGLASWMVPEGRPELLAVVLPAASVLALLPFRLARAPRWLTNPLARTQERWLVVVHTARAGSDLVTTAIIALPSAALAMLAAERSATVVIVASACLAALGLALTLATRSYRRAARAVTAAPRVRMAAVVADVPPPGPSARTGFWPLESESYRDVESTARRYEPHLRRAAAEGARVVVFPEVALSVDATYLLATTRPDIAVIS